MRTHRWLILAIIAGVISITSSARGQNGCAALQGLSQAYLGFEQPLHEGDVWGGGAYLTLDGQEMLIGVFSGEDGTDVWHGQNNMMGQGKGGSYTFAFNKRADGTYADTFTTEVTNAVFPNPPGKVGLGHYQAAHKIVSGTGRFRNASGNLLMAGTYVVFPWAGGNVFGGRWNGDISGKICGVDPAPQQ
jgi:hypothetical protein